MHRFRENNDIFISDDDLKGQDLCDVENKLLSLKKDIYKIILKRLDEIKITKNIQNLNRFIDYLHGWDVYLSRYDIDIMCLSVFTYACKNNWDECIHLLLKNNDVYLFDLCGNCNKNTEDHDEILKMQRMKEIKMRLKKVINKNKEDEENENEN